MNPYAHLTIDPFAVAHNLQMPACIFEAFKKTMCGGHRGHKDSHTDYSQAIDCLMRYKNDVKEGLIIHYLAPLSYAHFINEVLFCYHNHMQVLINQNPDENLAIMLGFAYLAGVEILNLFHPDHAQDDINELIDNAINNLNAALYHARYLTGKELTDTCTPLEA